MERCQKHASIDCLCFSALLYVRPDGLRNHQPDKLLSVYGKNRMLIVQLQHRQLRLRKDRHTDRSELH